MNEPASLSLYKRSVCEALGTGLLVAAVVGSGIMGKSLAGGNTAMALSFAVGKEPDLAGDRTFSSSQRGLES